MSDNPTTGQSFTRYGQFATGLTGVGVQIVNSSTTILTRAAADGEFPSTSGLYYKVFSAAPAAGHYVLAWDNGAGVWAFEDLYVDAASSGVVVGVPGTGTGVSAMTFLIKRNDTDPALRVQCLIPDPNDRTGVTKIPYPIPAGATAEFTMRDVSDFASRTRTTFPAGSPKVHAAATIDDRTNGLVSYQWVAGDTNTDGNYRGEFEITLATGEIQTFPSGSTDATNWIAITITDDLDPGLTP